MSKWSHFGWFWGTTLFSMKPPYMGAQWFSIVWFLRSLRKIEVGSHARLESVVPTGFFFSWTQGGHPKASNQWDEAVPAADMSPRDAKGLRPWPLAQSFLLPLNHLVGRNPMMPPAFISWPAHFCLFPRHRSRFRFRSSDENSLLENRSPWNLWVLMVWCSN